MEEIFSSWTVDTSEAAHLLLSKDYERFLRIVWESPKSVTEISRELEIPLQSAYYRIKKLLDCGIIEVSYESQRSGKPIKYYAPKYNAYKIPFNLTEYETLLEAVPKFLGSYSILFTKELISYLVKNYDSEETGFQIDLSRTSLSRRLYLPMEDQAEDVISIWLKLSLTRDEVQELVKLAQEMIAKGKEREGERYIFGLHLIREGIS